MLADDLAQETFVKAFCAWDTFRALSSPKTWLMRIAYTTFCEHQRNLHVSGDIDNYLFLENSSSLTDADQLDIRRDIRWAMQQLSQPERVCVQLFLIEDLSIKQVAHITNLNENTVKSHIARGKEKLKKSLSTHGYDR